MAVLVSRPPVATLLERRDSSDHSLALLPSREALDGLRASSDLGSPPSISDSLSFITTGTAVDDPWAMERPSRPCLESGNMGSSAFTSRRYPRRVGARYCPGCLQPRSWLSSWAPRHVGFRNYLSRHGCVPDLAAPFTVRFSVLRTPFWASDVRVEQLGLTRPSASVLATQTALRPIP